MPHSKDMAHKRVPFGHKGFDKRVNRITFSHSAAYENVAYVYGYSHSQIPKIIVDGWIKSPGHRKNMLTDSNVCGIAVYKGPGD